MRWRGGRKWKDIELVLGGRGSRKLRDEREEFGDAGVRLGASGWGGGVDR